MKFVICFFSVWACYPLGWGNGEAMAQRLQLQITEVQERDPLAGIWNYEVLGVVNGYEKGLLIITKSNGDYIVEVVLDQGSLPTYDVGVMDNTIQFLVNIDGTERVAVVLEVNGHEFKGEAITKEGRYSLNGTKKFPEK